MGGILSNLKILEAIKLGDIQIDPFNEAQVNITSYDLTLGSEISVYEPWVEQHLRPPRTPPYGQPFTLLPGKLDGSDLVSANKTLDSKTEPKVRRFTIQESGFILRPGIGYLMHTRERIHTVKYNPILDGKSSIGRLFIQVHATAGYGDPGFDGQYTLEVIVQHPIVIYAGMRFCQIRFHTIEGELGTTYDQVGHYVQDQARGAIPSQAWRQFKTD